MVAAYNHVSESMFTSFSRHVCRPQTTSLGLILDPYLVANTSLLESLLERHH